MKLGVMTRPQNNVVDEIGWAVEQGFEFVDLLLEAPGAAIESTDWRAIAQAIADGGVEVVCQSAHYLPLNNPSPLVRQAALDEVRRSIDVACQLNAPILTVTFQGWPSYLSESVGYEYTSQLLKVIIKHGHSAGVAISLENSPHNQHQLKYFREIFHRQPNLRLTYDIGHANVLTIAKHTTRDYLFALSEHLVHVHLSDNDGTTDDHLLPGTPSSGGIDLAWELGMLANFGYDERITLEIGGERRWLAKLASHLRDQEPV
ncbi:MAG: sugar phosphate isomerase/epimerase family protein [Chloroflexota bacterium]